MIQTKLLTSMIGFLSLPALAFAGGPDAKGVEFFESKIRPVLSKHCYECHSAQSKKLKAGLLLDTKAGMLEGGDNGPTLVPGKAKESDFPIKDSRFDDGFKGPQGDFIDGIVYDGRKPNEYLGKFKIGLKPADAV